MTSTKLMQSNDCNLCNENMEFVLKLTITKLKLLGKELIKGFEDIAIVITLDGNIVRIENIDAHDENVHIERHFLFQLTPENFNKKLRNSPIMINLSRGCNQLGTIRIATADCFASAVMCDDFLQESYEGAYTFTHQSIANCEIEIIMEITRELSDCKEFTDFLRKRDKALAKKKALKELEEMERLSESRSGFSSLTCDDDITTELCPLNSESDSYQRSTTRSYKSSVKCRSDIATSLDVNDFGEKTFCHGCGGFSISGITCDNKKLSPAHIEKQKSKKILNRICSECFEDITPIPNNAPCPKCEQHKRLLKNIVCFKDKKQLENEEYKTRKCVRSIFEEILLADEEQIDKDIIRLKQKKNSSENGEKKKKTKKFKKKKNSSKSAKRCDKIKRILKARRQHGGLLAKHPGVIAGHKTCTLSPVLVPKNMGWLWNAYNPGIPRIRRGWKPGAVPKVIAKIMKYFLFEENLKNNEVEEEIIKEKPGLQLQRKNGEYKIVMNPAGGDGPITFKISKSDELKKREEIRKILKKRGVSKKCPCEKIEKCKCINDCKKKEISLALKMISLEYKLEPPLNFSEICESSDSEMDFEYTPPFNVISTKLAKKRAVCYASTQYEKQEIEEIVVVEENVDKKKKEKVGKTKPKVEEKGKKEKKKK